MAAQNFFSAALADCKLVGFAVEGRPDGETIALANTGEPNAAGLTAPPAEAAKHGVSKAGMSKPGVSKAGVAKSGVSKSGVSKSGVSKSGVSKSGVSKAGVSKMGVSKSGAAPGL